MGARLSRACGPRRCPARGPVWLLAEPDPSACRRGVAERRLARSDAAPSRRTGPRLPRAGLPARHPRLRHAGLWRCNGGPLDQCRGDLDRRPVRRRRAHGDGPARPGRGALESGQSAAGIPLLDEAMVSVASGEVSPITAGILYCASILSAQQAFDLRRVHEWTVALDRWSGSQADLVPFRGQCLVHRSEIKALHGAWPEAFEEARRACDWLSDPAKPTAGLAFYQLRRAAATQGRTGRSGGCLPRGEQVRPRSAAGIFPVAPCPGSD